MEETTAQQIAGHQIVSDAGQPTYIRIDRVPALGPTGLTVSLTLSPFCPGDACRGAQVALACAEHAAGWSIGLDAAGRVSLVLGTQHGPVRVVSARRLEPHHRYRVIARIPDGPGRLELRVQQDEVNRVESTRGGHVEPDDVGVLIGARAVASRGPLLWGCRSLFDGEWPELPFDGLVGDVRLDAGAAVMSWSGDWVVGFPA